MALVVSYGNSNQNFSHFLNLHYAEMLRLYDLFYDSHWLTFGTYRIFDPLNGRGFWTDPSNHWIINLNGGDDVINLTFWDLYDGESRFVPSFEINGGEGNDMLGGSYFDDTLNGGAGADVMIESYGNDVYIIDDNFDDVIIMGVHGGGIDRVESSVDYVLPDFVEVLELTGANDISGIGNQNRNTIIGNIGDNVLDGLQGADLMIGGNGNDVYVVDIAGDIVRELFGQGTDIVETFISYTLTAFVEQGFLSSVGRNQFLIGNGLSNLLVGNSGNNTLSGLGGPDELSGGLGRDTLFGGDGADTLDGNAGVDMMVGGLGNDLYYVDNGLDVVLEENATSLGGIDTVFTSIAMTIPVNVERLVFNGESDGEILSGNLLSNYLLGNYTDDIVEAGGGNDSLFGGSGNDTLGGGSGNDTLNGGFGSDWLEGGQGRDILSGGVGADIFAFIAVTDSSGTTSDRILDFETGIDRIDVRLLDASSLPGDQAFNFIANLGFSAAGQIRTSYSASSNVTLVLVNLDADFEHEMTIILNGQRNLSASDFIL